MAALSEFIALPSAKRSGGSKRGRRSTPKAKHARRGGGGGDGSDAGGNSDAGSIDSDPGGLSIGAPPPWSFMTPGEGLRHGRHHGAAVHREGNLSFVSLPSHSALLRLHEEVLQFSAFLTPTPPEERAAEEAKAALLGIITELWPASRVEVFGSRSSGLVLPTSDWDLVVFGAGRGGIKARHQLADAIRKSGMASYLEVIDKARVPIVKMQHKATGLKFDMCFDVDSGPKTSKLISRFCDEYVQLRPLVVLLKYYLAQRGLNETYTGGVGSFMTTLMVMRVIQLHMERYLRSTNQRPGRRVKLDGKDPTVAAHFNLATLLLSFFELYGVKLKYQEVGVAVRDGGHFYSKRRHRFHDVSRPFMLSVENPLDTSADVGKGSYQVFRVKQAFEHSYRVLLHRLKEFDAAAVDARRRSGKRRHSESVPAQRESILDVVIHADELLQQRHKDLQSLRQVSSDEDGQVGSSGEASGADSGASADDDSDGSGDEDGSGAGAGAGAGATDSNGGSEDGLDTPADVPIRRKSLLAHIFNRKNRKEELNALATQQPPSWY